MKTRKHIRRPAFYTPHGHYLRGANDNVVRRVPSLKELGMDSNTIALDKAAATAAHKTRLARESRLADEG